MTFFLFDISLPLPYPPQSAFPIPDSIVSAGKLSCASAVDAGDGRCVNKIGILFILSIDEFFPGYFLSYISFHSIETCDTAISDFMKQFNVLNCRSIVSTSPEVGTIQQFK